MKPKFSVKAIRINLKLSQTEMAKKLDISKRAYVNKELGVSKWYFDEIIKISQLSNIDVSCIEV